jgi:hypothetical protein
MGTDIKGKRQLAFAEAFLNIHLSVEESEIAYGSFHVLSSALSLNTIENNRCLADLTEESIHTACTVGAADAIDTERHLEKAEPTGIGMLTHITAELVRGHIIVVGLQRNAIQQQFIILKKTLRSTTGKQPTQQREQAEDEEQMSATTHN